MNIMQKNGESAWTENNAKNEQLQKMQKTQRMQR